MQYSSHSFVGIWNLKSLQYFLVWANKFWQKTENFAKAHPTSDLSPHFSISSIKSYQSQILSLYYQILLYEVNMFNMHNIDCQRKEHPWEMRHMTCARCSTKLWISPFYWFLLCLVVQHVKTYLRCLQLANMPK